MGLNYLEINRVKHANSPLCLTKEGAVTNCCLLSTKMGTLCNHCFTAISNNWLTLHKYEVFRVMNEFKHVDKLIDYEFLHVC